MVFAEHTCVELKRAIPRLGLLSRAIGVVIHVYPDHKAYDVEFLREDGTTIGVETIAGDDLQLASLALPLQQGAATHSENLAKNPAYDPDGGPLSAEYLAALRRDARTHMPNGGVSVREDLFESPGGGKNTNEPLADGD